MRQQRNHGKTQGRRGVWWQGGALFVGVVWLALVAGGAAGTPGSLTQLAGTDGCVSEDGTGGACADGTALDGAFSVAVSPDGAHVYVAAAFNSDAVAVFARDGTTGALTQLAGTAGCVSNDGTGGPAPMAKPSTGSTPWR